MAGSCGELALFDVFDPGAVDAEGHVVFGFACHRAGVAADAAGAVEQEAEAGQVRGSRFGIGEN